MMINYNMNKKANSAVTIFILIFLGLLIWGVVGGIAARDPGVTCDMGVGNALCWKWHTNTLGQVSQFFDNIAGS